MHVYAYDVMNKKRWLCSRTLCTEKLYAVGRLALTFVCCTIPVYIYYPGKVYMLARTVYAVYVVYTFPAIMLHEQLT